MNLAELKGSQTHSVGAGRLQVVPSEGNQLKTVSANLGFSEAQGKSGMLLTLRLNPLFSFSILVTTVTPLPRSPIWNEALSAKRSINPWEPSDPERFRAPTASRTRSSLWSEDSSVSWQHIPVLQFYWHLHLMHIPPSWRG